jgi:hypothetical protein
MRKSRIVGGMVLAIAVIAAVHYPAGATTYAPNNAYTLPPSGTFTAPPPVVYGQGANSFGGGTLDSVLSNGIPVVQQLLGGGGLSGALPGLLNMGTNQLPQNLQQYGSLLTPALSSLLTGGNFNVGSLLSGGMPIITDLLDLDPATSKLLGNLSPALGQLLSGNINAGSLLSTGLGVLGGFLGNNPVFSTTSGILGGILGGGSSGTGIDLSGSLSQVYSNPINAAINGQIFSGGGSGSGSANTVLAQTGSSLCLYNSSCIQSNPTAYKSLYATATGAMDVANPNEVRARIAQLSRSGVRPDAFSSKFNSEQNAYYEGNKTDQEISRATTVQYLSKVGQAAQKQAILAAQKTAQTLATLSDQCDKKSKSSQELIRCTMKINTAVPSFQAAQIELQTNAQIDTQFMKNSLGNISSATDGLNRAQDVDRSAMAARLFQDVTLSMPISGRQ